MALLWTGLVLLAVLACAVIRPWGLPEAAVAIPAALLVVAVGAVPVPVAIAQLRSVAPTVEFLAAMLVLGYLCEAAGVFAWSGAWCARASRSSAQRLLVMAFVLAAVTTAALSLDATVVLLTPVVLTTAARLQLSARPPVYACTHLANSASLLLPVSNLTNLLAFAATGLSFAGFAGLMVIPWLVCIAVEYVVFRRFFRSDLGGRAEPADRAIPPTPLFALIVLAGTLAGFMLVEPVRAALAAVLVLGAHGLWRRSVTVPALLSAISVLFLLFVLALSIVVEAVQRAGLQQILAAIVPSGQSLPALLAIAGIAAVLANLVNNLPAVLLLIPVAVAGSPGAVLAVLIGVNVGPNLTYVGSLATLLWRRVLIHRQSEPSLSAFLALGAATVPICLATATTALWGVLTVSGS